MIANYHATMAVHQDLEEVKLLLEELIEATR
jgi:hypothetical protein